MSFGVKALMVIAGVVTVAITTLLLTSRPMDVWMLARNHGPACDCGISGSWEKVWNDADAVFTGRVIGKETGAEDAGQSGWIHVTVERLWKDDRSGLDLVEEGPLGLKEGVAVDVAVERSGGCHLLDYRPGSPYLILADRDGGVGMVTGGCAAGNRRWTRLDELLLALGVGAPPEPPILGPSQVRGPMLVTTMALCALVVFLIAYVSRDPD